MKIRAVRVCEVGLFSEPVAIEGLSGGVDVLCGPNEMGKSTLFRAIVAAFQSKYTTTSLKELQPIRPRTGGDPMIEIDFEARGQLWRIRKRFGGSKARMAELTDLAAGRVVARGGEAEDQLDSLSGRKGPAEARFGLLWVGQDTAQLVRPPAAMEQRALESAIAEQIKAVAGGAETARVRRQVKALLDDRVTSRGARANSDYALVLAKRNRLASDLEQARTAEQRMTTALEEMDRLRSREAQMRAPEAAGALQSALADAELALSQTRRAQALHSEARAKVIEAQRAAETLAAFDRLSSEQAEIDKAVAGDRAKIALCAEHIAGLEGEAKRASECLEELLRAERSQRELFAKRLAADARAEKVSQLEKWTEQLREARPLAAAIGATEQALRENRATRERLSAIETEHRAIALLDARLDAALPTVSITYEPGGQGAILIDGVALPAGSLRISGKTLLQIAGVGAISIEPGVRDLKSDFEDRRAHAEQLDRLLSDCGAETIDDARLRGTQRQEHEQELSLLRLQLASLAPNGVEALEALVTNQGQGLHALPTDSNLPDRTDIERALKDVARMLPEFRGKAKMAADALADARTQLAKVQGELNGRLHRLAGIEREIPPVPLRGEHRQQLMKAARDRADEGGRAEMAARSLAQQAPTDVDIAAVAEKRTKVQRALASHSEELQSLVRRIAGLEGELEQMFQSGGGHRARELEGDFALADGEVKQIERDIEALRLLDQELDAVEREQREHYLGPVTARIAPYLAKLFPSAAAEIGSRLDIEVLHRNGASERLLELSGGTQEQIAVLVRLAFGRLLADSGYSTPVILDDALVYSDDARIAQLFKIIEEAGTSHQVIVMTCRSSTFASLGGTHLKLQRWQRS